MLAFFSTDQAIDRSHEGHAFLSLDADQRAVVLLTGELDLATEHMLSTTFDAALVATDGDVVVDLAAVTFLDAATVRSIIRARELLHHEARDLTLRHPSRAARRLLHLCGLCSLIESA